MIRFLLFSWCLPAACLLGCTGSIDDPTTVTQEQAMPSPFYSLEIFELHCTATVSWRSNETGPGYLERRLQLSCDEAGFESTSARAWEKGAEHDHLYQFTTGETFKCVLWLARENRGVHEQRTILEVRLGNELIYRNHLGDPLVVPRLQWNENAPRNPTDGAT